MNKQQEHQTKQASVEAIGNTRISLDKTAVNAKSERSDRVQSKRLTIAKSSMTGSLGSRTVIPRRVDRLKTSKNQNTYRLDSLRPFHPEVVDKIVCDIMESKLSLVTMYQPDQISKLSAELSGDLIRAIKKKDFHRYKLVAQVSIIQRLHQSIQSAFECFWDMNRDNYSYYVFENCHVHAWCCLFGLYYE